MIKIQVQISLKNQTLPRRQDANDWDALCLLIAKVANSSGLDGRTWKTKGMPSLGLPARRLCVTIS